MARPQSKIGAHVSVHGGLMGGSLAEAQQVGAEVIQVFVGNPRGWADPRYEASADDQFRLACIARELPVFVHAPYLINFGSPDPITVERSARALAFSLRRGRGIGAAGVVMHAGSALRTDLWTSAMSQVRHELRAILDADDAGGPGGSRLLIEATAGGGGALASDIASIAAYLDFLDDERVGLCIDTCHLHAAGHDLSSPAAMRAAFAALAAAVGNGRIALLHVNDSRDGAGSRRDRHASIGAGTIGAAAFRALFTTAAVRGVPIVVETEKSAHAGDIAALKCLRGPARSAPAS